jgi:hypothetical protein
MNSEEYQVKIGEFFEKSVEKVLLLHKKKVNKSRLDFMGLFIEGLICAKSVQYAAVASEMRGKVQEQSHHRRIQSFMSSYSLDYEWVSYLLLLLLPQQGKITLCIDRTSWDFGGNTWNILVVTAYSHGVGVPIWFEVLENNGGNSDADDKEYMLLKCIEILGKSRIKCVIGDSEFMGEEWVNFLLQSGITFYLDIRCNQFFEHNGVRCQVQTWMKGRNKSELNGIKIFKQTLNLGIKRQKVDKKSKRKPFLAVVSNSSVSGIIGVYKNRWSIEVFFQSIKKRGFDIEATHLTDPIRIRKLFALVAIAFLICFVVGLEKDKIQAITIKNHGYKANSFFRTGRDFLRKILKNRWLQKDVERFCNDLFNRLLQNIEFNFLRLLKIVM